MVFSRTLARLLLLTSLTVIFLIFLLFAFTNELPGYRPKLKPPPYRAYFPPTPHLCNNTLTAEEFCTSFPRHLLNDVQVIIKTGIGERAKLEALLSTYGSCISNALIVSDAPDTVQGRNVHDILADLPDIYAQDNTDWAAYEDQRHLLAAGKTVNKSSEGWRLDRFKFLPMIEYAYAQKPAAKWYVFVETDTYFFWDTLFGVLDRLDPEERHYLGTAVAGSYDRWFAYGGAGFILSQGLLRDLPLSGEQRLSAKHEAMVKADCCGDAVLAYVLHAELEARIGNLYPTFLGDEPQWSWISSENWCVPLLALHRLNAESLASLWHWERCRASTERPVTFATFLDWGLAPVLANGTTSMSHWDNGAELEQKVASPTHASASVCFKACEASKKCMQASYSEGQCHFANKVRPGQAVEKDVQSSWDLKKLAKLGWQPRTDGSYDLCAETKWLTPKIMLPP